MNSVSNFSRSDPNGNSNAQDILEKRRRQIEKTRAANLSKQLQMRLRYARLKVEHGWQTLNEVENLYFHHYRGKASLDSNPISKPKKAPPREKVHGSPKVDKDRNATASGSSGSAAAMASSKDSLITQTPTSMDGHLLPTSHSHSFPTVRNTTSPNVGGTISSTSALSTEADPGNKPADLESFSRSPQIQDQLNMTAGPNPSDTAFTGLSPTPRSEPPVSLNDPKSGIIPTSSTTQIQTSIAGISTSTSHPTASSSLAIPISPVSGSTATHLTYARVPSKLPIPRLPAVSYPYTGVTSPVSLGKARKGTQLSAGSSGSRYSVPSSSTSGATVPPLSPYKHPYTATQLFSPSPSISTALQTTSSGSSLASNSSESSSLPLTYDSFWSSHTSSSSLPLSYRTNLNPSSSLTFASSSTLPTTSLTPPASSVPSTSTPLTASTSMSSANFPFTSFHNLSPSSISSLSHSPMVPSLLHSQGLFQQAAHSPPTVGASNQNATLPKFLMELWGAVDTGDQLLGTLRVWNERDRRTGKQFMSIFVPSEKDPSILEEFKLDTAQETAGYTPTEVQFNIPSGRMRARVAAASEPVRQIKMIEESMDGARASINMLSSGINQSTSSFDSLVRTSKRRPVQNTERFIQKQYWRIKELRLHIDTISYKEGRSYEERADQEIRSALAALLALSNTLSKAKRH
ncbi:hypothetical protein Clacol_010393 [Clathrus columnatus]|uniref:Uncharacterized protein n=1 Tax=Clathrus columnatus TaxID=1419009 RepID=A0AAV5ASI4_9AGAM|nr:hypothetical protein Clacol_010393 [Clathrus columnatus]